MRHDAETLQKKYPEHALINYYLGLAEIHVDRKEDGIEHLMLAMEQDWQPERIVMLKFPSREKYEAFINDPDYKPWKEMRESLTTIKQWMLIEGM